MNERGNPNEDEAPRPEPVAPVEEKLEYLLDLVERLIKIGEKLTTEAIVTISPDPEMLANAVQLRGELGRFSIPTWRTTLACPAGATRVLPFNIPPGWVTYRRRPAELSSDFYDPNIGVNIYSDGILINPTAPMPLTGAFTVDMGEYVSQWTRLTVEIINGTVTDAIVSIQIATYLMDRSFWDEFIVPGMDTIQEKAIRLITAGGL